MTHDLGCTCPQCATARAARLAAGSATRFERDGEGWAYNPDALPGTHPWPIWRYIGYPDNGLEALIAENGAVLRMRRAVLPHLVVVADETEA